MKENLNFYHSTVHSKKCKYDELIIMLGFQIQIRLDLGLFDRILHGAMGVRGSIFHARIPIGIRVVANLPDLRSLILHLWKHYLTDCFFEKIDFEKEKRVHEP
jgi:hypothetical protein